MPLKLSSELPSFSGASEWINDSVISEELYGKPVLVHFWNASCHICIKNLRILNAWKALYGEHLNIVAVHLPQEQHQTDIQEIYEIAQKIGITEPCAVDNSFKVKEAFQNDQSWVPAYFLFDSETRLCCRTTGETGLITMKTALERLIPTQPVPDDDLVAIW